MHSYISHKKDVLVPMDDAARVHLTSLDSQWERSGIIVVSPMAGLRAAVELILRCALHTHRRNPLPPIYLAIQSDVLERIPQYATLA